MSAIKVWRDVRNSSVRQCEFLDALTCQGQYAYLLNRPHPPTPYVLYGGCGFAGKSYTLRTATLELNLRLAELGFPGQWGCLCAGTFPELQKRHIRRLEIEMGDLGQIRDTKKLGLHFQFYDPAWGSFQLTHVDGLVRGSDYAWMLLDELTEQDRETFDNVNYTIRSDKALPFVSFGTGTNPDGRGHEWVKRLWVQRDFDGEPAFHPDDFILIQARPEDNPTFNEAVDRKLRSFKDPQLVKARREGSWDLNISSMFPVFSRRRHVFSWQTFEETFRCERKFAMGDADLLAIYGSLDFGTAEDSATAFYLYGVDESFRVWVLGECYIEAVPTIRRQVRIIRQFIEKMGVPWPQRIYCDPSLVGRDSDGISRLSKFTKEGLRMMQGLNDRIEGWATVNHLLDYEEDPEEGVRAPRLMIHESCHHLIRQLEGAPRDERHLEDVSRTYKTDHAIDSLRYFVHSYVRAHRPRPQGPEIGSLDYHREQRRQREREAERYERGWV